MKLIPKAVSLAAARSILTTKKHSPETLFVAGIVGMGATIVLACRATLKVEEVLLQHEETLTKIDRVLTGPEGTLSGYSEQDAKHDKLKQTVQTSVALGKLYGPAIIVGVVSVSALAGSHNILSKRNAALTAAYGTISKAFDDYRSRVREAYGDDRERELYEDVQVCEMENPTTGKIEKRKVSGGATPYSFIFDRQNPNWEKAPEYNFLFLKMRQQIATDRLRARGHLFLNEVLEDLGIPHTKAGAVTGWVLGQGDDFVDFGIFNEAYEERIVDFMIGREEAVMLTFNVSGTIFDKI